MNNCVCAEGDAHPVGASRAEELAAQHWSYISSLLDAHGEHAPNIDKVAFHYKTAFIHGYKHAEEDCTDG